MSSASTVQAVKHQRILRDLRQRIVVGELAPAARLPTRRELAQQYGAGPMTVQRALDHLLRDGLVVSRGKLGTFVARDVPHLCRYALVFHSHPQRSYYIQAMVEAAAQLNARGRSAVASDDNEPASKSISLYFGVDGHADAEDYQRLVREVRSHQVAGLIFSVLPASVMHTPLMQEPGVPRVAMMARAMFPGVLAVAHDYHMLIDKCVGELASQGRRRIAFVGPAMPSQAEAITTHDDFHGAVHRHGLETRPQWVHFMHAECPWTIAPVFRLLADLPATERPDGLVILDDHFVEEATRGLLSAGFRVPQDVAVAVHCNYPLRPATMLPVTPVGFDAAGVLQTCMDLIDAQRRGETMAPVTMVPALTTRELSADHPMRWITSREPVALYR